MYTQTSPKLFARYAIPQMLGTVINSVYIVVDGVFIGNRLGREAMAAAAVAVPAVEVLIALSLALSSGAGVLISRSLGRGEQRQANRTFHLAVWLTAACGLLLALASGVLLDPLATALGATPDIHADTVAYLRPILLFSPFLLFSFLLSGLIRSDDRPRLAMTALAVGAASNILLDYVFLYPLNMGIAGAALATAIGPIISVLILLPHFLRGKGNLRFARGVSPQLREISQILVTGFPAFVMEFSIGIVTLLYNWSIARNGYGELGLAAYLVVGYLALILLTCFLGAAQGLQPLFSYFHGKQDREAGKKLLRFALGALAAIGVLASVLVVPLARPFAAVFNPGDRELIAFIGARALPYFCGFVFAGVNILLISYWQSVQRPGRALGVALARSVIALPVLLVALPLFFGAEAIWLCHSLTEAVVAALAIALLLRTSSLRRVGRGALPHTPPVFPKGPLPPAKKT